MKNHLSFSATIDTLDNKEWFGEGWVGKSSDHNLAQPNRTKHWQVVFRAQVGSRLPSLKFSSVVLVN